MLYMARLVSRPVINNELEISENRKKFRNYYETRMSRKIRVRYNFYEIKMSYLEMIFFENIRICESLIRTRSI